jgi:predicted PurR-regulated permease PerM
MMNRQDEANFNWGWGLGLGAVVGILASAIIAMLKLSKTKNQGLTRFADSTSFVKDSAENLPQEPVESGRPTRAIQAGQIESKAGTGETTDSKIQQQTSTHWSTGTKYFVSGLLLLTIIGIVFISSGSISTIVFAALLTFIVHPIIKFFQRRLKMKRGGATLITYLIVLGLLILIPFLIIPSIVNSLRFLADIDYLAMMENGSEWLEIQASLLASIPLVGGSLSAGLKELAGILSDIASQNPQASSDFEFNISFQDIGGGISQTLEFLSRVFGPIISIATTIIFTLLISLHMSLSIDMLREGGKKLIPEAYKLEISSLVRRVILIWNSFLRGQMSLMVVVGVIVWIGNGLLGTPQALLLGVLAGLLEVIPSLGPILATIPAVILALIFGSTHLPVENWIFALIVIAFYVLVQVVENQLLVPYILGDAVDLPPLIVIIGVVIGGSAFGLLGVFLATPVISTGREIFMYLYNKILEPPPEPEIVDEKPSIMETIRNYMARLPRPQWTRRGQDHPEDLAASESLGSE